MSDQKTTNTPAKKTRKRRTRKAKTTEVKTPVGEAATDNTVVPQELPTAPPPAKKVTRKRKPKTVTLDPELVKLRERNEQLADDLQTAISQASSDRARMSANIEHLQVTTVGKDKLANETLMQKLQWYLYGNTSGTQWTFFFGSLLFGGVAVVGAYDITQYWLQNDVASFAIGGLTGVGLIGSIANAFLGRE